MINMIVNRVEQQIIFEYVKNKKTLRAIARQFNTDHHKIKRILTKHNILLSNEDRIRLPFTDEHKQKLSKATKNRTPEHWQQCFENLRKGREKIKGMKRSKESLYKNMRGHLRWNVELEFLMQFDDIDKLKFLNSVVSRDRVSKHFDTGKYKEFICKFYYDRQFNFIYKDYLLENKANYSKPSLDHIIPLSKGGSWNLDNLQFLPWVVNRAKYSFMPNEWEYIKEKYFRQVIINGD